MRQPSHSIQRQNLHIAFHADAKPDQLSVQLSRWLHEKLLPAMEAVFDEAVSPSQLLRMDSITIHAGNVEGEDWEEVLVQKICRQLARQLAEAPVQKTALPAGETYGRGLTLYNEAEKEKLVFAYLQTGQLPWYAAGLDASVLAQWTEALLTAGTFSRGEGKTFLLQNNEALRRFLLQTKPALLEAWFNQWSGEEQRRQLPTVLAVAKMVFGQNAAALRWSYALLFDDKSSQPALWKQLLHERYGGAEKGFAKATEDLPKGRADLAKWKENVTAMANGLVPLLKKKTPPPDEVVQAYFVGNAGAVLLHPFLKNFFTRLRLLNGSGDWMHDDAQRRGVLLLHYLCTGSAEAAEYELPLCKLLTGHPLAQPVEMRLEISGEEEAEATDLLQSVIEQWPILKTTSPDGLRQSFLQREGKLSRADNGWLLQVEQKSFDVLLSHLPWGIGVIKNSWMTEMLFTEWV